MSQSHILARVRRCPRCGARLLRDERSGLVGQIAKGLFLRALRCKPECGWSGFRFSRTQFRRRKRHLKALLVVMLFVIVSAVTVRYLVLRHEFSGHSDEGVQEVD